MKKAISVILSVIMVAISLVTGQVITAAATGANLKTTLTDLAGQGGLSYTSQSLMNLDSTSGLNTSAMSASPRTDRRDRKEGRGAVSVTASGANSKFVLFETNVGAFNFTVTDTYAQNVKMWVYVSDCDAIECDHDSVYDTPQEDSFTFWVTFGNSKSSYNYTVQHTMHGSGWQEIDINFATDNVTHKTRKNINWNFKYMNIRCRTTKGVTVKFDDIRLIQYSTTYQIPECENNGRWVSTCDYNALDGGIITEWYGSSFDLQEKTQGTSSLRIDGYPIHVDYRITLSGMSTKAYYDTDVFCMDMYIDDIKNMSTVFEARIGENESGSSDYAYYTFSYGLMNAYANGGEGLKSGWNKLQMPLKEMMIRVCEDYYGEGYEDFLIYKITFYNPATAFTGADAPYTFRFDNMYVTDASNLDLSFANKDSSEWNKYEPSENTDKIKTTGGFSETTSLFLDNGKGIVTKTAGVVNFDFIGTDLKINTQGTGLIFVSVDNTDEQQIDEVYSLSGLGDFGHTVRLRAEGTVYIDSIEVFGRLTEMAYCEDCQDRKEYVSIIDDTQTKSVSDMICTLNNVKEDFSVADTSTLNAPEGCPETAYLYETTYGTQRKNGFAVEKNAVADLVGNEEEWTLKGWVYISDITSYQLLLQIIPYSALRNESLYDTTHFASNTENWAYRYRLFASATEEDPNVCPLVQGWNYLEIPISSFSYGTGENNHTNAAYELLRKSKTIGGITIHENNGDNYGKYTVGVANLSLERNTEHTCYSNVPEQKEYKTAEVESYYNSFVFSNAWVKKYNKNFSGRNAYYTSSGGKVNVTFYGTNFGIVSYKSPSQGKIYVSIDGGEEVLAADLFDEKSDTYFKSAVYESPTLKETKHIVSIRAEGKVYLDAFLTVGVIDICNEPIKDDVTVEVENMVNAVYTGSWSVKYAWKHSGHNAMFNKDGGSVTFDFEGDALSILSYMANTQGKLFVSVDGAEEIEVDLYDDSADTYYAQTVYYEELSYSSHTVTVRTQGNAYLDAIVVHRNSCETVTVEGEGNDIEYTGSWSVKYAWKHSGHNAMFTSAGGTAAVTYKGYDFEILSYKARTQGKMFVCFDGGEEVEISLYDDSTDTLYKQKVYSVSGLGLDTHTITIRTEGKVYLDAILIDGNTVQ